MWKKPNTCFLGLCRAQSTIRAKEDKRVESSIPPPCNASTHANNAQRLNNAPNTDASTRLIPASKRNICGKDVFLCVSNGIAIAARKGLPCSCPDPMRHRCHKAREMPAMKACYWVLRGRNFFGGKIGCFAPKVGNQVLGIARSFHFAVFA